MRVLIFANGFHALGETFTSSLFAQELLNQGHRCRFFAPKLARDYLLTFGFNGDGIYTLPAVAKDKDSKAEFDSNYKIFKQITDSFRPDIAVVVDWHHYDKNGMAPNSSYSIYWLNDNIPIVTFDHLGIASSGLKAGKSEICRDINDTTLYSRFFKKDYYPVSDRYSHIIKPCPHHPNLFQRDNNNFYWGIYKDSIIKNTDTFKDFFNNPKVIFQPIGLWQERGVSDVCKMKHNVEYDYYRETLIPIMIQYLTSLNQDVTYILISGKIKEQIVFSKGKVRIVLLPPLKHNEFMLYLQSADLFITDSLMSSNLGKAVFCKVPSLTLRSNIYVNNDGQIQAPYKFSPVMEKYLTVLKEYGLLYPFYCFPMGMCELEKTYNGNNFTSCFDIAEIYDEEECLDYLHKLLYNEQYIRKKQEIQQQYILQNQKLMSATDILENCR
jgi:hypothetical protein